MTKEQIKKLEEIGEEIGYGVAMDILNVLLHRAVEKDGIKPKTVVEISRYVVKMEYIKEGFRAEMLRNFQVKRNEIERLINTKQ